MDKIIKYPVLSIAVKILIPAMLLFWIYKRMKKATDRQLKIANKLISIMCSFYGLVVINNFVWLIAYNLT